MLLAGARDKYFEAINELIHVFLFRGLDLVEEARNTERFIKLMVREYFGVFRSEEEREQKRHWPKIFWFMRLQEILEEESLSVGEAFVKGFEWFIDAEQYPTRYETTEVFSKTWSRLSAERQQQFLQSLKLDKTKLGQLVERVDAYWSSRI
jgi:hypothetical protein